MADQKISQLTELLTSASSDILPIVTGGVTKKITVANLGVPIYAATLVPNFNGIKFPATQVASADANTLDDYEEGTWTPTLASGFTTSGTITITATYTKIGRLVFARCKVVTVDGTIAWTVAANISGLPFTPSSVSGGVWANPANANAGGLTMAYTDATMYVMTAQTTSSDDYVFNCVYEV